jgi:hypothetical protein
MADLNFPTNPNQGDTHVVGLNTYTWNGYAWIVSRATITATSITSIGSVIITDVTDSTGTSTGALQVAGGATIGGDLWVGGVLHAAGMPVLTTASFVDGVVDGTDIDIVDIGDSVLRFNNISTLESVTARGNSTTNSIIVSNNVESTSTDSGALVIAGGLGVGKRITAESIRITNAAINSTQTLVNTTASTIVDSFSLTEFRSAKYLIQIDEGIGAGADFELIEILLIADNDGGVWATEYGVVTSNGDLGIFAAEISSNMVNLYFTAHIETNKTVKVLRTGMVI